MSILKTLFILLVTLSLFSCGSSKQVIADDGTIYDVNGNTFKSNGINVTKNLSEVEKKSIRSLITKKEQMLEAFESKQSELEKAIADQTKLIEQAENKQKELEYQLEDLEAEHEQKLDAQDNFASIQKRYNEKKNEFDKLKKAGKLSPNDIEDWEKKLKSLKTTVNEAKIELNKF